MLTTLLVELVLRKLELALAIALLICTMGAVEVLLGKQELFRLEVEAAHSIVSTAITLRDEPVMLHCTWLHVNGCHWHGRSA